MTATIDYVPNTHTAIVGDKEFTVRNLIPIFSNEDAQKEAKQKIENCLYGIFHKYMA